MKGRGATRTRRTSGSNMGKRANTGSCVSLPRVNAVEAIVGDPHDGVLRRERNHFEARVKSHLKFSVRWFDLVVPVEGPDGGGWPRHHVCSLRRAKVRRSGIMAEVETPQAHDVSTWHTTEVDSGALPSSEPGGPCVSSGICLGYPSLSVPSLPAVRPALSWQADQRA